VDYDGRSSVFSMGELGILWENDRKTGAYRAARDLGYQTMVTLDPKTGRVQYRAERIPKPGAQINLCPAFTGFKSWRAMAYHPDTQAFYVPLNLHCMDVTFLPMPERAEGGGGVGLTKGRLYRVHPNSAEGLGEFAAMDIKTGRILWRNRTRGTMSSAALTTGGGLVVVGDSDRNLYVHDVATGKILFQTRLSNAVGGFPITYAVRGRQYLAIPASTGSAQGWADVAEQVIKDQPFATNVNLL
jgi:alcohol dehydrogenase (cytochrome c)